MDLMAHRASVVFDPAVAAPEQLVEAIRGAGYDAVLPRAGEAGAHARMRWRSRREGVGDAGGGRGGDGAGDAAGNGDGRAGSRADAGAAVAVCAAGGCVALVSAGDDGGGGGVGGARDLCERDSRAAARRDEHEHAGEPGNGGGVCVLGVRDGCAGAGARGLFRRGAADSWDFCCWARAWRGGRSGGRWRRWIRLSRLRPATARRIVDGVETVVPLEEVRPGDSIVVLPGERFPVDATIVEGRTTVDESMLTGESTPLEREVGGRVLAGSLNYDGAVVCRAESLGEETVLAQIARMVDQAQSSRAPMERLADRASAIFVPVVLGLAAVDVRGVAGGGAVAAAGAGEYGGGAGDRVPVRDGAGGAGGADRGCGARRAAGSAVQGRRGAGAAGAPGRDRAGQDGDADGGEAGAGEDTGTRD